MQSGMELRSECTSRTMATVIHNQESSHVEERRVEIRRQADRELISRASKTGAGEDGSRQESRKRRRAIRHACKAELNIEVSHQQGGRGGEWVVTRQRLQGHVLDLSEDGASFFIKYPASTNQNFNFLIKLHDGRKIEGAADVRWVKQKESANGYAVGTRFTRIDNRNLKLIALFLEKLDETLGLGDEV